VKDSVATMPTDTAREGLHAARCRWVLTVLYLGGLRASELTATTMGALFCRRDAQGIERWWLEVTGKGNKTRLVSATDELIAELARYRRANDLHPTPQPGEALPLVLPVIGREQREGRGDRDPGLSRGALHLILKEVFGLAAARLRARARMGDAGRCPGQRLGPLAAPHRRLAHDRPAGRPALWQG
jgi:integrase